MAKLQGEEGVGKSWISAEFAWRAINEGEAVVSWLESTDWRGCRTIEEVLAIGLRALGFREEHVRQRLVRKIVRRWNERVLVILDGANEIEALPTAQTLILDLFNLRTPRLKLLVSARPLDLHPAYNSTRWEQVQTVEAAPFNDAELATALNQLTPPLRLPDVPPGLANLTRIPRYATCMRLRDHLGGLERR